MRNVLGSTRRRRALALGAIGVVLGGSALASPAQAALVGDSGSTTVTFTVGLLGGVSILPAPVAVGLPSGSAVSGTIATVVTDLRTSGGSWTDTVTSSGFTLVGATAPGSTSVVPATATKMWTTSAEVAIPGTATIENVYTDVDHALNLSGTGDELVSATTSNVNVTALVSSFLIDVTGKDTGAYTGTITQTVS